MSDDKSKGLDGWKSTPKGRIGPADANAKVRQLNKALSDSEDILIKYYGGSDYGGPRKVRPIELFKRSGRLYLSAMCRVRGEERVFRLDRLELEADGSGAPSTRKTRKYPLDSSSSDTSTNTTVPASPTERTPPPATAPPHQTAPVKTGGGGCLVLLLPLTILGTLTIGLIGTLVG